MPFFGAMYYVLRCRTSLTVTSTAILTSPSNYAYFGTSDDVPGLITEVDTSEQLIEKLQVMIPELLQANGLISENDPSDIPLHLLSKRTEMIKSRVN